MQTLREYYDEKRKLLDKYYWHKFELRKASETCDNCIFGSEIKSGKYEGDYCCKARFESGDKVRIGEWARDWYEKHDPKKLDITMTVEFQDGEDVYTDKGWFPFEVLELIEG